MSRPRLYILFNGQPVAVSNAFHAPRMRRRKWWGATALRAYRRCRCFFFRGEK